MLVTNLLNNAVAGRRVPIKGTVEGDENVTGPCCWETLDSIRCRLVLLNIKRNRVCLQNEVRIIWNPDLKHE